MKIGIIGGGSIGLLFSYYLSKKFDVKLYVRTIEQANNIQENGLQLKLNGIIHKTMIKCATFEEWTGEEEITFIAVKQYHLDQLLEKIIVKQNQNSDFVFLQNGMGHLKKIEKLRANNIYVSTVEHGAYKQNSFTVEHNGVGKTKVALFKGERALPTAIYSIPNFHFCYLENYYEMLIQKLVVNAVINPLTALLKVKNGHLIQNEYYYRAATILFEEVANVLELRNREHYIQTIIKVCENTAENRSSMLRDIESNQLTEVDAIIGYILEEAEKKEIAAPICRLLYFILKGSEMGKSYNG